MTKNNEKQTNRAPWPAHWISPEDIQAGLPEDVPRKLVIRHFGHEANHYSPYHCHSWGQLLFISEGLVQVSARDIGHWIVPPQRAVWIPPFIEHDALSLQRLQMHNVYICPQAASGMPDHCQVVHITPLLRELIMALSKLPRLYDEQGADGRMVDVFLDQLKATPEVPLHLPQPKSQRLQTLTSSLQQNPADNRPLQYWADQIGCSERTLARRFHKETGMTFGQWRQQARLLEALSRIASGQPIASIAQDLGYSSQSAFISMFRKALGKTPTRYFQPADSE
ncbi:AraC family transcriptional regulator [Aliamphritea spongicola]|uniref:AraC family transcriptional regulator n=1 Tax=Aliamphritea spongicola TaxID=707589 RepID=UPI00196B8656|nr:helix-turn-helix transcriptional regulator [Aliamphritea spongicola]MBN3562950.1 helix-turn-helix transcriptional regulator [Aliamphritea spongicola]